MNTMLVQLDDDTLQQVSGGADGSSISFGPDLFIGAIDGAVGALTGTVQLIGDTAKAAAGLLPTVTVSVEPSRVI